MRITNSTAAALTTIAGRSDLALVTSTKLREEVLRAADPKRRAALELLYALMVKLPHYSPIVSGLVGHGHIGAFYVGSGESPEPLLERLRLIFDADDADHVFQAVTRRCDFFLTLDEATILGRGSANATATAAACGNLAFVNPEQLVQAL